MDITETFPFRGRRTEKACHDTSNVRVQVYWIHKVDIREAPRELPDRATDRPKAFTEAFAAVPCNEHHSRVRVTLDALRKPGDIVLPASGSVPRKE